jgi:DNA-binding Xre family transcriptional regulator
MAIVNRFNILLVEKRAREQRDIPLSEISKQTGLRPRTLFAWANNTVTRFDAHVINAICCYFNVKPGELFEFGPDDLPGVATP